MATTRIDANVPCAYAGCPRTVRAAGLCAGHYAQRARGQPLTPLRGPRGRTGPEPMVRLPGVRVPADTAAVLSAEGPTLHEATRRAVLESAERWARHHAARRGPSSR